MVKSITELTKEGYSRTELMAIVHAKDSPAFKTVGGGKWLIDMDDFRDYLNKRKRR